MYEMVLAVLLGSLRIGPVLAFAPPFTLIRVPMMARIGLTIAVTLCALGASGFGALAINQVNFVSAAASELLIGIAMALCLQLGFAVISLVGRALDIQAGFGLAFLIDPTTRAQMPLIGAIFTYAAAAIFFTSSGPADVLAVLGASFDRLALGSVLSPDVLPMILAHLAVVSVIALGVTGLAALVLLLIDLVIAMMSRTLPQMNVLVLGFQVKAMAALILLPITLGLSGGVIARILRLSVEAMARVG